VTGAFRSGRAHKISGVILIVAGMMLFLVQLVLRLIPIHPQSNIIRWLVAIIILLGPWRLLLIFAGAFLFWRGRQYAAKAAAERIITDPNPDVLYLRPFRSDPSIKGYVFSTILQTTLTSGMTTQEEQLAEVLRPIGDLVAIGQPGEDLPKPGAARIYASDEEWKEVVKRQMRAARLVIIRAGGGENLLWEMKQAVETLNPQKVLILVLQMKAKHYESFRTKVNPVLGVSLPERGTLRRHFGRFSGFIGFGADWKPNVLPLGVPNFRRDAYKPYRQFFKFALRPVFERFGLEWQPPPNLFWFNVIIVLLVWAFVILLIYSQISRFGYVLYVATTKGPH
jgi:hypothetical protein